ncbi:hypothetical protein K2X14_09895 [Acetobacter sp. TBRC 12305]|uniref:DUF4123 domain-containing protein n=1 Tax=Acetobacter garciniae TaxID=2817435 RepID=A0A939KNV5_9PROT|nr:hypothetical protein [Acetobacter garciniae]MBO1326110.1 hypothetical protein [Acetobacter garciniae]MBX0345145.1 hypothetical protein [Acetobacter garciniae]
MPSIYFRLDDTRHEIELFTDRAPRTLGKLLATLPAKLDIHCAKIAGQHIFWHAPLVEDAEQDADILTLKPGSFLYWPERQFLELIYGELQAEDARVTLLGQLRGDIGWLRTYGQQVIAQHGHRVLDAWLEADENTALSTPALPVALSLQKLQTARKAIWQAPPVEFMELAQREGLMLPFGPLAMAEGEFRKLHELLWRLRVEWQKLSPGEGTTILRFLIDAFNARIAGFCHLHESAAVLEEARQHAAEMDIFPLLLDELILYCGRAAAWLDTFIPWNDLNEVTRTILTARKATDRSLLS